MSTLNGQNNEHDQELLHAIDQIVQGKRIQHTIHTRRWVLAVGLPAPCHSPMLHLRVG
jgi:hypothetical protein